MKRDRAAAIFGVLAAIGLATGCETLGKRHQRSVDEIVAEDLHPEAKPAKATWSPGAWSGQARDIEKSIMKTSPDATWER